MKQMIVLFIAIAIACVEATNVTVDWNRPTGTNLTILPSLQVVAHSSLVPTSPIHDQVFRSLAALKPKMARYASWFPYPRQAVAELDPPTQGYTCTPMSIVLGQVEPVLLTCGPPIDSHLKPTIASITFASFGTPRGYCGNFTIDPTCDSGEKVASYVSAMCVGKADCWLDPAWFENPCPSKQQTPYFAVQARCSVESAIVTHWNFTVPDSVFGEFWEAVEGNTSNPIVNFCTQPAWLFSPTDWSYQQQEDVPVYSYTKGQATSQQNFSALADYYGRLLSWYTLGGFINEAGFYEYSGHYLNITTYEVFNEVDYEHGFTAQTYTLAFDAIVRGIRKWADPDKSIKFVGLSLPNIDDTAIVASWANYFLNASNHDADVRDSLDFIGYHAYPTNGPYTSDPKSMEQLFAYADDFVDNKVKTIDEIIKKLSPTTQTLLDETGTDMDNVLTPGLPPPKNNPTYWVASGAYFAYMYARLATNSNTTVRVFSQSQLMDGPPQEPSVTMLDWTTGLGTARYWVLKLLIDSFAVGDVFVSTSVTNTTALYAQGWLEAKGGKRSLLVINKLSVAQDVFFNGEQSCAALVVDTTTGLGPARSLLCDKSIITLLPFATAVVTFDR